MHQGKAFTIIELLIVMAVLALLMGIPILAFRGLQDEARKAKAQGDVQTLKVAVESYYKNHANVYPPLNDYQAALLASSPSIIDKLMYDPFGETSTTPYRYALSNTDPSNSHYYIIYSIGSGGGGTAYVDNSGTVTASGEVIWGSNGHL